MKLKAIPLITLIAIFIASILTLLNHYHIIGIPETALMVFRWLAIVSLLLYGWEKKSLTSWILISMVVGAEIGNDFSEIAINLQVLSKVFLKMIKTIVAPLLFATLVYGIAGHSDLKQVGRMGWKSLVYFEVVTTLALFIGLLAINISKSGVGIKAPTEITETLEKVEPQTTTDIILHVFPENIAKSIAEGQVLQVVVFSIIFGIALAMVREDKRRPMLKAAESLSEVMFKFTNIVMYFAPIGVGAAIAFTVGHMGLGILLNLFQLLATLYVALIAFLLLILLPIALIVGVPIKKFLQAIAEPVSIAFATTSSEAALPRAMESMQKLGVPQKIVAFVIPTGYSFNLDGTTNYLEFQPNRREQIGVNLSYKFIDVSYGFSPSFFAKNKNAAYLHICEGAPQNESEQTIVGKTISYLINDIIKSNLKPNVLMSKLFFFQIAAEGSIAVK